jgi:hypothetical protein
MMKMQLKFFEGDLETIQDKFNVWSNGEQYVSETSLHFPKGRDKDYAILQVIYGEKTPQDERPVRKSHFSLYK